MLRGPGIVTLPAEIGMPTPKPSVSSSPNLKTGLLLLCGVDDAPLGCRSFLAVVSAS
jgi:hypothetical protein